MYPMLGWSLFLHILTFCTINQDKLAINPFFF